MRRKIVEREQNGATSGTMASKSRYGIYAIDEPILVELWTGGAPQNA
jgi:hypothetical protein